MTAKGLPLILWIFFVHLAGLYFFIRGFLLTRLSLVDINDCSIQSCTLPATHAKAVLLIIDALRFDFVSPDPPLPHSPFHHNVLTLPRLLSASQPNNSVLFQAYADPPTTTLQRIKGLTTGSLPTFVELGSNFGATSIAEDSLLHQLKRQGKKVAFMGDDTWMNVFPETFHPQMTFPYDSFNVEDLHTVDNGVIEHLFPLLDDSNPPFHFLVGHFLGVDHVGHRVGPDHLKMKEKLEQMNFTLTRVVDALDDDTLLIVLGDHGMDHSGDHGGDGELETSAAVWIYSKRRPIASPMPPSLSSTMAPQATFPGSPRAHRHIQQIDLVCTIALLLGLPIPYGNLGSVIPELFWRNLNPNVLARALELNALQIKIYLDRYRASPLGKELDEGWSTLQSSWASINVTRSLDERLVALQRYNRLALEVCRAIWAQFDAVSIIFGLALLSSGTLAAWALYSSLENVGPGWEAWSTLTFMNVFKGLVVGAIFGVACSLTLGHHVSRLDMLDWVLLTASLTSCFTCLISIQWSTPQLGHMPFMLILHSVAFTSNSFTFWEDHLVPFFLMSSIIPFVFTALSAPQPRLYILGFALLFAICVRLMATSTVCREEQQPFCHVTFFASSTLPSPPMIVLLLSLPVSIVLPYVIQRFLQISKSDHNLAAIFLPWLLRSSLVGGGLYWLMEWVEAEAIFGNAWANALRTSRTVIARCAIGGITLGGGIFWWRAPLRLEFDNSEVTRINPRNDSEEKQYTNSFGSPYLIFWTIFLSFLFAVTQLTGQIMLALAVIALLSFLEVIGSAREALTGSSVVLVPSTPLATLDANAPQSFVSLLHFSEIIPVALLGLHTFYATGHQATISSIQWKSAFVLTPTVTYPFSPVTVTVNSFGSFFLFALAVPLIGLWNRPPLAAFNVRMESTRAAFGIMTFYACLLLGTATSAAVLRRHLMVWKVFAPRFMAAAGELLAVDLAVVVGVGFGVERVVTKVTNFSNLSNQGLVAKA